MRLHKIIVYRGNNRVDCYYYENRLLCAFKCLLLVFACCEFSVTVIG